MRCPNCKCIVPNQLTSCDYCGYRFLSEKTHTFTLFEMYQDDTENTFKINIQDNESTREISYYNEYYENYYNNYYDYSTLLLLVTVIGCGMILLLLLLLMLFI